MDTPKKPKFNEPAELDDIELDDIDIDDDWEEEEGRKLLPGEMETILRNAPASAGNSRPLRDVLEELGIDLDAEDDEDF